jgi:hypothetical protein
MKLVPFFSGVQSGVPLGRRGLFPKRGFTQYTRATRQTQPVVKTRFFALPAGPNQPVLTYNFPAHRRMRATRRGGLFKNRTQTQGPFEMDYFKNFRVKPGEKVNLSNV